MLKGSYTSLKIVNFKLFLLLCSTLHLDKIWHTKECVCLLILSYNEYGNQVCKSHLPYISQIDQLRVITGHIYYSTEDTVSNFD